ncbi:MAG: TetR/AcrR family transcriptional regulator [Bifidobacteriaceae bacterium]|jgi:AcrR family transcriptional regulator|nr:TetR/AcrR family transcriptional regulator [Bifidobacteriaceae bacterium]
MTQASSHRYSKGIARRQEIINTAMQTFSTVGYNKSSMMHIASEVGLTRAGLAHYFPSKESLLTAVLDWRDAENEKLFLSQDSSEDDPLAFFHGLLTLTAHNATVPGLIGLYTILSAEASDPEHPAHDYFVNRYRRTVGMMRAHLESAQRAGYVRSDVDVFDIAIRITAMMDGLQTQWLLSNGNISMEGHLRPLLQEVLNVHLD